MLKVLQVNKLYYPVKGGIEKVVQQVAEGLCYEVDMKVLVCKQKGKSEINIVNNVEVHRAGSLGVLFSMPISFSFLFKLRKLSKEMDVIQFHVPFPLGDLGCLLSGYKGKVVLWWHSDIVRQKKLMKLFYPIMKRFLKRVDTIIVATEGHIEGSKYLKDYREKCVVIPYGIENATLNFMEEASTTNEILSAQSIDRVNTCDSINTSKIDGKVLKLLFVGRLVYYKGCDVLIKAMQEVENVELTMIGTGALEEELKTLAKELNVENNVRFLGEVENDILEHEFMNCDVFVLPSVERSEAFGIVQIEAMRHGKPVINTNLPSGVPYVSIHNETGLTIEPSNVEELSNAILWMRDHEDDRILMGKNAISRVQDNYQLDDMLSKVLDVYKS